jgi:hypothetical protein
LTNWEYWPGMAFYWPMLIGYPWQALRTGHLCFFTAANPGIYTGGLGMESKYQTLLKIPEMWRPRTVLVPRTRSFPAIFDELDMAGIGFPLIVKPDVGYRGLLVKKIHSKEELEEFLGRYPIDFLLQEFLEYPEEIGVLYCRLPGEHSGNITSLTLKEFLHIIGDGQRTVRELIRESPRALLQMDRLQKNYGPLLDQVPSTGERISLGVIGNHSKGTRFIDANYLIDKQLVKTFDRIATLIEGFNYGRFDIKCHSFDELREGRHFKIIEINGVCSEPTHIYDSTATSYYKALRDIWEHWALIRDIGLSNHERGVEYLAPWKMIRELIGLVRYRRRIRRMD